MRPDKGSSVLPRHSGAAWSIFSNRGGRSMKLNDLGRVIVSFIVVVGFIMVTVIYMTRKLDGNAVPEILSILLGALATNFTAVVGYWIGSSASSSAKDTTIQNMAEKSFSPASATPSVPTRPWFLPSPATYPSSDTM